MTGVDDINPVALFIGVLVALVVFQMIAKLWRAVFSDSGPSTFGEIKPPVKLRCYVTETARYRGHAGEPIYKDEKWLAWSVDIPR
jgi:hypothetical protein